MGKLVIKFQGKLIGEVTLKLGDTKIGRKAGCDIVLNDAAVSGEHAVVKTVGLKSSVQDLDSTNGTFVESNRVKQHELRHGETIIIGGHALIYRDDLNLETPMVAKQPVPPPAPSPGEERKTTILTPFAQLLAIDGKDKGKRISLIKDVVVLDNPGKKPARISRTAEGYVLEASVGPGEPTLNGRPLPGAQLLEKGDIIEVAGTKFQFFK